MIVALIHAQIVFIGSAPGFPLRKFSIGANDPNCIFCSSWLKSGKRQIAHPGWSSEAAITRRTDPGTETEKNLFCHFKADKNNWKWLDFDAINSGFKTYKFVSVNCIKSFVKISVTRFGKILKVFLTIPWVTI